MEVRANPTTLEERTEFRGLRMGARPERENRPIEPAPPSKESAELKKAAIEFEGLLLAQMLQSIRESALGGWQENHDQGGAVALEMAETQLAQVMASQGGLGIARTLAESMKQHRPEKARETTGSGA